MSAISNLGYLIFGVSDLVKWEAFAVDILGMQVGRREQDRLLALRMDEHEQRIVLEKTGEDELTVAGWQFDTEEALESFVRQIRAAGVDVVEGGEEVARKRRVLKVYGCDDPNGFRHEFYFGPTIAPLSSQFRSSVLKGPGFETGPLGLGHIFPLARDYRQTVDFYRNVLGLKISDYIVEEVQPGVVVDATFFHASTGRHHSIATAQMPHPKRIHHFMVQVKEMNDVGLAYDRCIAAGVPIELGLGHHPNDRVFSFYARTPSGFSVEYGWGAIVVDDAHWEVMRYSQLSDWGHKPMEAEAPAARAEGARA